MGRKKKPAKERVQHFPLYPKGREIDILEAAAKRDGHKGELHEWILGVALIRAREIVAR